MLPEDRKWYRQLEPFSRRFARFLFARHPEWRQFAQHSEVEEDGFVEYHQEVQVPPENPVFPEPLLILTRLKSEVYIGWAGDHAHIGSWWNEPRSDGDVLAEALEVIDAWMSDDHIVRFIYEGDREIASSAWRDGMPEPALDRPLKPGQRAAIRSWRGTHDRELGPDDLPPVRPAPTG